MTEDDLIDDVRNALREAYQDTLDMDGPNFTVMARVAVQAVREGTAP